MKFLRSGQFWGGVIVGYLLLMVFPQLSIRTVGAGKKMKKG
jgi:hypothetical protein